MQTILVIILIGLSIAYLVRYYLRSLQGKKKNCPGCGKD